MIKRYFLELYIKLFIKKYTYCLQSNNFCKSVCCNAGIYAHLKSLTLSTFLAHVHTRAYTAFSQPPFTRENNADLFLPRMQILI